MKKEIRDLEDYVLVPLATLHRLRVQTMLMKVCWLFSSPALLP